jgi:hypothetical protein
VLRVGELERERHGRAGQRHLDPPRALPHGHVQPGLEAERPVELQGLVLVDDRDADGVQAGDDRVLRHDISSVR